MESEYKLRTIFESLAEGVLVCNISGIISQVNNSMISLFGYNSKEQLIGQSINKLIDDKDINKAFINRRDAIITLNSQRSKYTGIKQNGTKFDVEFSIAPISDSYMQCIGFVYISRDITLQENRSRSIQSYISLITKAQEEERTRIARELHDITIHSLINLSMDIQATFNNKYLSMTMKQISDNANTYVDRIRDIIDDLRRFSYDLRPEVLEGLGLFDAFAALIS